MFLINKHSSAISLDVADEFYRLSLLENAVINYAGGMVQLEARARAQAELLSEVAPDAAELLNDVATYLHDVAECGHLDIPPVGNTP
ncbi:hypothetical protein [Dryocola sp. BD626]|jgi:hypothetical protein|uniref:hypothetical protein n=1 Tax=Dryocola sp. BD626 TaxID=3133273 RepID=UPI003F5014B2